MYRIVYMSLSNSDAELSKFLQEIGPRDFASKPIQFGLRFISEHTSSNYFRVLDYMVLAPKTNPSASASTRASRT